MKYKYCFTGEKPSLIQHYLYVIYCKLHRFLFGLHIGTQLRGYPKYIHINDSVHIGPNVSIISRNHNILHPEYPCDYEDVYIGAYSWIGAGAIILPGVTLGPHTVVGAGAVVTRSFPDGYCVIVGNPADIMGVK